MKAEFVSLPLVDAAAVVPESIPEWVEKQAEIKEIEATIKTEQASSADTSKAQERKSELNKTRDELKKRLANRDTIRRYEDEIKDLEKKGKDLAQQIADAEKKNTRLSNSPRPRLTNVKVALTGCSSTCLSAYSITPLKTMPLKRAFH